MKKIIDQGVRLIVFMEEKKTIAEKSMHKYGNRNNEYRRKHLTYS